MSFRDFLRDARSGRVSILHKFLTSYDPNGDRVFAFVEGDADVVFYHSHIRRVTGHSEAIYMYNCEGKGSVYEVYRTIVSKYPTCRRVLFFADKDIDDFSSVVWPIDPRIFVTDVYSVENYCVCEEALLQYFRNFVKVRRADLDAYQLSASFGLALQRFHKRMQCIMAWIIAMRRSGVPTQLRDVNLSHVFSFGSDAQVRRKPGRLAYLHAATRVPRKDPVWRVVRKTCVELQSLAPKSYIRGKFEAWWFAEFVHRASAQLASDAKGAGGSTSIYVPFNENTFAQLLADAIQTPLQLQTFLRFHLAPIQQELDLSKPGTSSSVLVKLRSALGL